VIAELVLLSGIVVAVATLTELPPGRADAGLSRTLPAVAALGEAPVAPPRGAFVEARRAGRLVVGFALRGRVATVTLIDPSGKAPVGVDVAIDGPPGRDCGPGCFRSRVSGRAVVVRVDRTSLRFEAPARPRAAAGLLRRAGQVFERLRTVVVDERVATFPSGRQRSHIVYRAPDRSSTLVVGGSDAESIGKHTIVIGTRRWERVRGGRWAVSVQPEARVPRMPWSADTRNAHFDGSREITFFDPRSSAWFRLVLDVRTARPRRLVMIAPGRVVSDRFTQVGGSIRISAPTR
jgi:hypothetical protein